MRYLISVFFIFFALISCAQTPSPKQTTPSPGSISSLEYAAVQVPVLPQELDFAGERVPLDCFDVRESLTRELLSNIYIHSRMTLTLLATTRYFPIIEPILQKNGVPDDFKYLCVAESGLNPNVSSPAGASGLWQLMKAYGSEAGLFMGGGVDDRFHVEKSTEAACQYLLQAYRRFGNWTLAAASYNLGMAGTSTRMSKQGESSYYDLYFPEETMRYVYRILAFKLIIPNPGAYGFQIASEDYQKPLTQYTEVSVSGSTIDWSVEAHQHGTSYKMLRELNHWIRDYEYKGTPRTFTLRVPSADFRK